MTNEAIKEEIRNLRIGQFASFLFLCSCPLVTLCKFSGFMTAEIWVNALEVSADYVLRDELPSGKEYICMEITEKLLILTPGQRKIASDILNAYLNNLL